MAEPWAPERVVSAEEARALLAAQHPDLARESIEPLGQGFDNTAYLVGGTWVFRFPRRQVAAGLMEVESRMLRRLRGKLPLAVPDPERRGAPSADYPWPFAGYRLLPGRTASSAGLDDAQRAALAEPVGRFVAALHAQPLDGAPLDELGRGDLQRRRQRTLPLLASLEDAGKISGALRRGLERALESAPPPAAERALVHGDLDLRHLMVDAESRPTGVIDWGDVHAGDPALDLSFAFEALPPRRREAFLRAAPPADDAALHRARLFVICHAPAVARIGAAIGDTGWEREGLQALAWVLEG